MGLEGFLSTIRSKTGKLAVTSYAALALGFSAPSCGEDYVPGQECADSELKGKLLLKVSNCYGVAYFRDDCVALYNWFKEVDKENPIGFSQQYWEMDLSDLRNAENQRGASSTPFASPYYSGMNVDNSTFSPFPEQQFTGEAADCVNALLREEGGYVSDGEDFFAGGWIKYSRIGNREECRDLVRDFADRNGMRSQCSEITRSP